jgi:hypothetical protein
MDSSKQPLMRRVMTGLTRFLVTLFLLGLVGLVAWLASERNARMYSVRAEADKLVVLKGRMLPVGSDPWAPGDPTLADAYAPIPLEGSPPDPTLLQARFADRDELDRALFGVLEGLARPRIKSEDPKALEQGVYYLRRAQLLTGLSQEQRANLQRMQVDIAFYQARVKLEQARQMMAEALAQLELASSNPGPNADRARQMARSLEGPAHGIEEALKETGAAQSPPSAPPAP